MIYLVYSILITTLLFVIFKYFKILKINTFQAIVVNYIVAFLFGLLTSKISFVVAEILQKPWFLGAVLLGVIFISIFNVLGLTAQRNGVTVVSVASKMSLVIPVLVGILVFHEKPTVLKVVGIGCALLAVYFVSQRSEEITFGKSQLALPIILFFGSGVLDALLNYIQVQYVPVTEIALYSATIFLSAGILGMLLLAMQMGQGKQRMRPKNIVAGVVLGIPNFYSIYFLLKALEATSIAKGMLFTINNVAVVLLSTIVGLLLFQEKLIAKNYIGIALALLAIVLVLN